MPENLSHNSPSVADDGGMHLLELATILAREKLLVIGTTVLIGGGALLASMLMTPVFQSTAKILPPQQQQSNGMAAMLGQLGGLASAAGGLAGLKSPNDMFIGLLESRTVADRLVARFKLRERYNTTMEGARQNLAVNTEINAGKKDGMIAISFLDREPQFAADVANAYVEELAALTQSMALTEASQRRLFFEKQLVEAKEQLANAEISLRGTQEKTGLIQPEAQVQAIIGNAAQLKGTIAAKEVQINAMRTYASPQNPELMRAQEELRSMQGQLSKLERSSSGRDGNFMVPTGRLPEAGVEYVRGARNVKYYETIFELLAKQYELAKIDEAKNASLIQMLDKAIPAENKFRPKRALIALGGTVVGFVLGMLMAFLRSAYNSSRQNALGLDRWKRLGTAIRSR